MLCLSLPQQVWLQSLMAHRVVTNEHARQMLKSAAQACEQPHNESDYDAAFSVVTRALSNVGLGIRRMIDQVNGLEVLALVNAKDDTTAQLATQYTAQDMTFIKALVRSIVEAPDDAYSVSSMQALQLGRNFERATYTNARIEALCNDLIRHGWIREDETGHYSLTSRSLLELQSYLKTEYPDSIHECPKCHDIVTLGVACASTGCDVYVHKHCRMRFVDDLSSSRANPALKQCSKCEREWTTRRVGVPTERSDRAKIRMRRSTNNDDNEEEEEEEEEDGSATPTENGNTRTHAASHGVKRASSEEEDELESSHDRPPQRTARRAPRRRTTSDD